MRLEVKTACSAYVCETWEVEVPDGLSHAEMRVATREAIYKGTADLIDDGHDGEYDREIISVAALSDLRSDGED